MIFVFSATDFMELPVMYIFYRRKWFYFINWDVKGEMFAPLVL